MEKKKAHISEKKKNMLKKIEELLKKYPNVGIADVTSFPCASLQRLRRQLEDKIVIFIAKKRIIKIALENLKKEKKGVDKLGDYLKGIPCLIFTKESPFKVYKLIQKNKSKAFAKPGQIAPFDIIIPAGPTQFGPGPIIGELGQFGIKTAIEGGKIAIKTDFVVAKKGEVIDNKKAGLLAKFNIAPMEIGLNVVAIYEDGAVFGADVLSVDEQQYINNITKAALWAINVSVEAAYVNKENANLIISKAERESRAVAIEFGVMEKEVVEQIISKINVQAEFLKNHINM
ncbi:MAG: 50S ribosomal protein L10 [Candidatus Woesearchaeota archaeon]